MFAGAVKLTVALPLLPLVTATPVGVPGSVGGVTGGVTGAIAAGVTAEDAAEAGPVPMAFVAVTVNV